MPGFVRRGSGGWGKLYDMQVLDGGAWRRVDRAYVAVGGQWRPFFKYVADVVTGVSVETSATALTDLPNEALTISGTVIDAATGLGVPAGVKAVLYDGNRRITEVTTDANGAFSYRWQPTELKVQSGDQGYADINAVVYQQGIYRPSSSNTVRVTLHTAMSVEPGWPASLVVGQSTTVLGQVRIGTGEVVYNATAYLFRTRGSSSVSLTSGPVSTDPMMLGSFSLNWTPDLAGTDEYYVKVVVNNQPGIDAATWTAHQLIPVYQPTPATPQQSVNSITNTSVKIKIEDQANVQYFISRCTETGSTVKVNSTGVAGTDLFASWSLTEDYTYHFTVTAYSNNPSDNNTSGNTLTVTTGHAAVTDSGSGVFTFDCVDSGSWRASDGWSYLGTKIGQGYYSSGNPYYGLGSFDSQEITSAVASYGGGNHVSRPSRVSVSKLEVYTSRVAGSGSSSGVTINFYCTPSYPGQSTAPTTGGSGLYTVSGPAPGAAEWNTIPSAANGWFLKIMNDGYSLMMYANNSSQYSIYYGLSSFKIRATLSWNYTEVAYKAPTYSG